MTTPESELAADGAADVEYVAVVKADCPTCTLIEPVLGLLAGAAPLTVYSQDDPSFPASVSDVVDDRELATSWKLRIDTVPTLLRRTTSSTPWSSADRIVGWDAGEWTGFCGDDLGDGSAQIASLPSYRPGCGSLSADPDRARVLAGRHDAERISSRIVSVAATVDPAEAMFDRGWTDGLPVVEPTVERVLAMLEGTNRPPDEVVAVVPPDLVECTVEKVAVNAVLAGCRPEYLPVVLAAVEAACSDEFNMHGLLATTWFAGPLVVVSGPVARRLGMESGVNALGQGNRANATIGRAVQLVVRNVGGGRPGGVDRATLGQPGKYTFCFAEREVDDANGWPTQAVEHGIDPADSAVTLFAAEGVRGLIDQRSRTPESFVAHLAEVLATVASPKLAIAFDAAVVLSPEHRRVLTEAGWTKARFRAALDEALMLPGSQFEEGARGIAEGMPAAFCTGDLPKFRDGGLLLFHAGGTAGMFSAVIGGWAAGAMGSAPVSRSIP